MIKKICFVILNRANYGSIKSLLNQIKKNKFFSEKLLLFSKLQNDIKFNNDNETKKYLNFFKNNTHYNIVYYQIENNFKKNEILNNLKKINNIDVKKILFKS